MNSSPFQVFPNLQPVLNPDSVIASIVFVVQSGIYKLDLKQKDNVS